MDIDAESIEDRNAYIINGIRKFEKDYEKTTFEILSSRNLLKTLIYYLNNEFRLKYVEIRDFLEIPRGVMDDLKQNNNTLF